MQKHLNKMQLSICRIISTFAYQLIRQLCGQLFKGFLRQVLQ